MPGMRAGRKICDYFGYAMLARRLTEILGEPVEVDESKADEPIFSRTLD